MLKCCKNLEFLRVDSLPDDTSEFRLWFEYFEKKKHLKIQFDRWKEATHFVRVFLRLGTAP